MLTIVFSNVFDNLIQQEVYSDPLREYEEHLINEICPNPDQMTYEQILELEEKMGKVDKGLHKKQIDVIFLIKFNRKFLWLNFKNIYTKI